MAVGQKLVPNLEPSQMEPRTQTGPYPGGLILTRTHVLKRFLFVFSLVSLKGYRFHDWTANKILCLFSLVGLKGAWISLLDHFSPFLPRGRKRKWKGSCGNES